MVVIVYYPKDPAARGAAEILEREYSIRVHKVEKDPPFYDFANVEDDVIIVLSRHKSSKEIKSFTVHHTGNIGYSNDLGGEPRKLRISYPSLSCALLRALKSAAKERPGYEITYEATHHGPTISKAVIFIEIGSSERQWRDRLNHYTLATAVATFEEYMYEATKAVWIGGPHYSIRTSRRCFKGEASFGHIVAKYNVQNLDSEMLMNVISKSVERVEMAYIEKKSTKSEQRKEIIKSLEEHGIGVVIV